MDAAKAWHKLNSTEYSLFLSQKGKKTYSINLQFDDQYFFHLAGMQYSQDVDFGLNRNQYYGKNLIPALLTGKLKDSKIESSLNYEERIKGRLKAIINLEDTLDHDFEIAKFNKNKVPDYCSIDADFVIRNVTSGDVFFVFLAEDGNFCYCKSAFLNNEKNYMLNQSKLTVLTKTKTVNGIEVYSFQHPNYNPNR